MKLPTTLLTTLLFSLLAAGLHAAPFDTSQPLEIELSDRDDVSLDELAYFKRAVERVFEARDYPGEYTVERWSGASQSDEGPVLDLNLIRWDTWTPTDFECRFYATAISHGERIDLGVFVGRADNLVATRSQQEERLVSSAAKALEKTYDALAEHGLIESKN